MAENCKVIKREVLYVQVQLTSPLSVSSGDNEWTDSDVLRDADGNPFVTGSSLAGAMRAYLGKKKDDKECFMGFTGKDADGNDDGKMSSLFVSDMCFDGKYISGVRDGVALNGSKVAVDGSKFDMEIIEAMATAHFYMELTIREQDDEQQIHNELKQIFRGIDEGEICLGGKKTRGFGRFRLLSVKHQTYDKTNFLEYAQSYKKDSWKMKPDCRNQWLADSEIPSKMVHIDVPLRMRGGISIRRYASKKGEPDFVHITDHGVPIIPGSSLAGALRHRIVTILWDMKMAGIKLPENINKMVDIAFGYVHGDNACASNIIIGETEIKNARPLTMVRTGVSRFESAVKQGTLYKEKTYVDGNLNIHIMVRKSEHLADEKWILGLLLLAIKDLQNGLLAVGGQTAIGRGIFEKQGPIVIDGKEGIEDAVIGELLKNMVEKGEVC